MKTTRVLFKREQAPRLTKGIEALNAKVEGKPTHYQLVLNDDDIIGVSAIGANNVELGFVALTDSSAGSIGSGWHSSKQHGSVSFRVMDLQ